MNVSIIVPTRSRLQRLTNMLHSVYDKAKEPDKVEVVLVYDNDDTETYDFLQSILEEIPNSKALNRDRSPNLNNDYLNYAAKHTQGKYIWGLGNDNEIVTENWDEVLINKCEAFLLNKRGRILYGYVADDIHDDAPFWTGGGCCFPIVSRESYEALGWFFPPEITKWGADHWLWIIYKSLKENRILDLRKDLKVLHYCHHNGRCERDELNREMERGSYNNWLSDIAITDYAKKLNDRII